MKTTKKILSTFLALLMITSIIPMSSITASAATFEDINQSSVFLKQPKGSVTCTLVAATMMVRRAAMMNGNSNWASITESSMKSIAWTDSGGLWYSFTYAGISVKHANLTGGTSNTATLISLLNQHPEGIVLYKSSYPTHAVLLTDYTNGVFYCADPGYGTPTGRIPISSAAYVTIANATEYWYVSSPKCTLTTNVPTTSVSLNSTSFTLEVGQTKTLTATVIPSNSTDKSVTWSSSNTSVATVSSSGVVTAKAGGTCTITVTTSGGQKATATVNVTSKSLKICVDGNSNNRYLTLILGEVESANCYLSISEYYGNLIKYSYSTSNSNVSCSLGSLNSSNQAPFSIYANSIGETTITISVKDATTDAVLDTINVYVTVDAKPSYTVSYDANGGTGAPASQQKTYGTSLTLSSVEPTKDGYLFLGWTTDDTNTIEYLPGDTFAINSDTTLYAVWVEISELILNNEWTVWTSTDIWVTSLSVAPGSDKPDVAYYYVPQKTGKYIFYSTNASDSEIYLYNDSGEQIGYDDDSGENLNFRLECDLVAGKEYTFLLDGVSGCNVGFGEIYAISYDANGGTGAPQSQQRAFNEVLILSDKIPNRSGYTFLGWSDSGPSGGVTYQPGGEMRYLAQDITLYAVWQEDAVAEPEVHVSSTSVNLKLGEVESTTIYAWATDVTCSYTVQYQIADTNIVSCVWGDWNSENKSPLTITAKSKGTTTLTISVINYETKEILDSTIVTVIVDANEQVSIDFGIRQPSTTTIRYKDGIALHIDGNIPDGSRVEWAIDSNAFDGGVFDNGMSCLLVSKNNGYATVVATLYDANNNVIATDSVELRSKAGFFDKIGGFFRSLFGTTKVYDA